MFWLYTGDVFGTLYTGQIELTSSGTSDSEELTWSMSVLKNKLQNGWNKVALPLSDAQKMSDADLSAINFFRIYDFVAIPEEPAEFRIDNVWVGTKEEALEEGFLTEEALTTPVTTEKPVSTGKPAQTTAQQTLPATQEGSAASAETSGTSSGSEGNIGPVVVISVVVIAAIVAAVILVRKKRGHGNG